MAGVDAGAAFAAALLSASGCAGGAGNAAMPGAGVLGWGVGASSCAWAACKKAGMAGCKSGQGSPSCQESIVSCSAVACEALSSAWALSSSAVLSAAGAGRPSQLSRASGACSGCWLVRLVSQALSGVSASRACAVWDERMGVSSAPVAGAGLAGAGTRDASAGDKTAGLACVVASDAVDAVPSSAAVSAAVSAALAAGLASSAVDGSSAVMDVLGAALVSADGWAGASAVAADVLCAEGVSVLCAEAFLAATMAAMRSSILLFVFVFVFVPVPVPVPVPCGVAFACWLEDGVAAAVSASAVAASASTSAPDAAGACSGGCAAGGWGAAWAGVSGVGRAVAADWGKGGVRGVGGAAGSSMTVDSVSLARYTAWQWPQRTQPCAMRN